MNLAAGELYRQESYYSYGGRLCVRDRPDFQVKGAAEAIRPFRDLPTKAFELLIPQAFRYAPEIAFAMCLQAFAGLRAGEAMNIRPCPTERIPLQGHPQMPGRPPGFYGCERLVRAERLRKG